MDDEKAKLIQEIEELAATQPPPPKVAEIRSGADLLEYPDTDYDTNALIDFLRSIFATKTSREHIPTWLVAPGSMPKHAASTGATIDKLANSKMPFKAMYCTSSVKLGYLEKRLTNRRDLFQKFYVLVLEGIGDIIPRSTIPEELVPTYIIEYAPGRYQYGYVLDKPLDNYHHARALLQIAYLAGLTSNSDTCPCKVVRLPLGFNCEPDGRATFRVNMVDNTGPLWRPESFISHLNTYYEWDDLLKDPDITIKENRYKVANASVYIEPLPKYMNSNGVIDVALEYMNKNKMIISEFDDWHSIECPWCDSHDDTDSVAHYSGIGYGRNPQTREFMCFSPRCATKTTEDFCEFLVTMGCAQIDVEDRCAELLPRYLYDNTTNGVWELLPNGGTQYRRFIVFAGMLTGSYVTTYSNPRRRKTAISTVWHESPYRIDVIGKMFDPSTRLRLMRNDNRELYVNGYRPPNHPLKQVEMYHVERFKDYLKYLMPDEDECSYFMRWLFAKVQSPAFRGCAMLMYTDGVQGIGRSTLLRMIAMLINRENTCTVPYHLLVGQSEFNYWEAVPFIMIEEAMNSDGPKNTKRGYERLKELIDPAATHMTINAKYQVPYIAKIHTSYLFLSNHRNAIKLPREDRRFYVISNTNKPETPAFFTSLNYWIDNTEWATHVYNWMLKQFVDPSDLSARPPMSKAKVKMLEISQASAKIIADVMIENINTFFTWGQIKELYELIIRDFEIPDNAYEFLINDHIRPGSVSTKSPVSISSVVERPRVMNRCVGTPECRGVKIKLNKQSRLRIRRTIQRGFDFDPIVILARQELRLHDYQTTTYSMDDQKVVYEGDPTD